MAIKIIVAAVALLGLQAYAPPTGETARYFTIAPGQIASATVRLDALQRADERICKLGTDQIAALLGVLQRSRGVLTELRQSQVFGGEFEGLRPDLTFFFTRPNGRRVVAVISKQDEMIDGEYPIFFRGRLAMLGADDVATITRIAAEAGCSR